MSDKEYKIIRVQVCIPILVELSVRWNEDEDVADIGKVAIAVIQEGVSPRSLCENLTEDDMQHIDDETKKVFGIEDS